MTGRSDQLLEDKSVVPLELLFDLVFVLGITQTVALIVAGHDGQALLRAALVLAILWSGWTQFTWTANSILALLSQAAVSGRIGGPVLFERVPAVLLIALLMLPAI